VLLAFFSYFGNFISILLLRKEHALHGACFHVYIFQYVSSAECENVLI